MKFFKKTQKVKMRKYTYSISLYTDDDAHSFVMEYSIVCLNVQILKLHI